MSLFAKYDVPAPRYTSYPTVPYWNDPPTPEEWLNILREEVNPQTRWSVYVHVPFCESLCTFCGCNNTITKNHGVEQPYVDKVLREWQLYRQSVPQLLARPLAHLHLGGGSPSFLSPASLERLLAGLLSEVQREPCFEGSMEVDPRRTHREQIEILRRWGFNRLSLGVQDFNPEVQRLINRHQPFEVTEQVIRWGRELGFESINIDLIYGLPRQDLACIEHSVAQTLKLRPDRLALYSFALVPWIKPQQRLFKDEDVPSGEAKRQLYERARELLLAAGYVEIGMDHFALPEDPLTESLKLKKLHRNFMGYTDQETDILLGLGVSSISETPRCFHQNEKLLAHYEKRIDAGEIPTLRGHKLTEEDRLHRGQIRDLMCRGDVELVPAQRDDLESVLAEMVTDGLVKFENNTLSITAQGRPFLRNTCMALDMRLRRQQPATKVFSQSL
jgi:oxygen-independent coproporphyrinogen-3 oxidase